MIDQGEIEKRLILHEGLVLKVYTCPAGYPTIGVGRNLKTNPLTEEEQKACGDIYNGITKNAALLLLRNDIEKVNEKCKTKINFYPYLDNERQYAILDMAFNLGIDGLLKFKKMLSYMSLRDYKNAARECLNSNYARQTGKRAKRIAKLIETGIWEI